MSTDFDSPAAAIRAFGAGALDLDGVSAAFDAFLADGAQVEDLTAAVDSAEEEGAIDAAQCDELHRAIAETMTVFAGPSTPPQSPRPVAPTSTNTSGSGDTAPDDANVVSRTQIAPAGTDQASEQEQIGPGTRLRDRFIIDEVLGAGGMGTVYRGRDALKLEARDRNPYLAIKVLNESFARRPDAFIALQREASKQQRLAHPNIATVFDFDRSAGTIFITMELLEGRPLDQYIRKEVRRRGGLPLIEAMPLIEQMCAALNHAHQRGIVHADFKPGNCFLTKDNEIKVLDFGIARAMKDPEGLPQDQTLFDPRSVGALTPAYASPEMLENSQDADPRDDLYALACVTYELLCGTHPFKRVPADEAKEQGMVPERIKSLSRRQHQTMLRGLAFEREDRIGSAAEFLAGLQGRDDSGLRRPAAVLAGLAVLTFAAVFAVDYLENMEERRLEQALADGQQAAIMSAIGTVRQLPDESRQAALTTHRESLLGFFERRYDALMGQPLADVPFGEVSTLVETAASLFPDSAALRDLQSDFSRRRAGYLSDLTDRYEGFLEPDRLVPSENREDLHDLLGEIADVDPGHPLLSDLRVATAYASAAAEAFESGDLGSAQQIVNSGLVLRVDDPALLDIEDRIKAAREAQQRRERIASLETQLRARTGDLKGPGDLTEVAGLLDELRQLEPDNQAAREATATVRGWIVPRAEEILAESTLPTVTNYLDANGNAFKALGEDELLGRLHDHRAMLVQRRDTLVETIRQALGSESDLASRRATIEEALEALARIDPSHVAQTSLAQEVVQTQTSRAERAAMSYDWGLARRELQLAAELALGGATEQAVREGLRDLEQREQVFREQVAAERAAEAERRRLAAVAAAEHSVRRTLESMTFDEAGVNRVVSAARRLEALESENPLVNEATGRAAQRLLQQAIQAAGEDQYQEAYRLIDLAAAVSPDADGLQRVRDQVRGSENDWREAERQDRIDAAVATIDELLTPQAGLTDTGRRDRIRQQFQTLRQLDAGAEVIERSRARAAEVYVRLGNRLIVEKRFSAADQALELAHEHDAALPALSEARTDLELARADYLAEREQLELLARMAAAEQQFRNELTSGQLSRAAATLEATLPDAPAQSFFHDTAPRLLADAYGDEASRHLRRRDVEAASQALQKARDLVASDARWEQLENDILALRAAMRIDAWIAAPRSAEPSRVRNWLTEHRQRAPDAHPGQQREWIDAITAQLASLRDQPARHNELLALARSVWPEASKLQIAEIPVSREVPSEQVADVNQPIAEPERVPAGDDTVAPTADDATSADVASAEVQTTDVPTAEADGAGPATPLLSQEVLFGKWCGSDVDLEFSRETLRFMLGRNQAIEYAVKRYVSEGAEQITVEWVDPRQGVMLMEFGSFSGDRESMQQLRGKRARDVSWQQYDRAFARCG